MSITSLTRQILLFVNPDFDERNKKGISRLFQIFCIKYKFELRIINEDFLKKNTPNSASPDILVIAGGDGTIHKVFNLIPECYLGDYIFGIIPGGTANEFARAFEIPVNIERAAEIIAKPHTISRYHLGCVNDKYKFATGFLYGMPDYTLRITPRLLKIYLGKMAFHYGAFKTFCRVFKFKTMYLKEFELNGQKIKTNYLLINNINLKSKNITEVDNLDTDDKFRLIYLKHELTMLKMIWLLVKNQLNFNILKDFGVCFSYCKNIEIISSQKIDFLLDGESYNIGRKIKITCTKQAINIISN
jgi:diacylglycerol kinase (ATP)